MGDFCLFLKIYLFNAIWSTFRTFLDPLKELNFQDLKANQSKKLNCSISLYLQIKSKSRLKSWIFGLDFVSAQVGGSKVYCFAQNFLPGNNNSVEDLSRKFLFCNESNQF